MMNGVWKQLIMGLLAMWLLSMSGCGVTTGNYGEAGIRIGQEFTFFSRASKTADEDATFDLHSQPFVDWLRSRSQPEAETETETGSD